MRRSYKIAFFPCQIFNRTSFIITQQNLELISQNIMDLCIGQQAIILMRKEREMFNTLKTLQNLIEISLRHFGESVNNVFFNYIFIKLFILINLIR